MPNSTSKSILLLALAVGMLCLNAMAQDGRRPFGRRRPTPILEALDTNDDAELSKKEIAAAKQSLLALDENGDGNLESHEISPRGRRRRGPPGMQGLDPAGAALDKDDDAELFDDEITDATESLLRLDENGDGKLDESELSPRRDEGPGGFGPPRGGRGFGRGERSSGKVPAPEDLKPEQGRAEIPDLETFQELSYQGREVMVDTHLAGLEFVKFQIEEADGDASRLYFMNTETFRSHPAFMQAMGMSHRAEGRMRGVLVYWPRVEAPNGEVGLFTFEFEPNDDYAYPMIRIAYDLLVAKAPIMKGRLAYNLLELAKRRYLREKDEYDAGQLPVFETSDRYAKVAFLPLHAGEAFGRLRLMDGAELPDARDIVIYPALPNEMPRVAGVITGERQTPLSHVNLRAIQDDIPNAFVEGVAGSAKIKQLLGEYVRYAVTADGWEIRKATAAEVQRHFRGNRPKKVQRPRRDLRVVEIRAFGDIGFDDADAFGVKAANLAQLGRIDLAGAETPQGFAIPFRFYDEFMKFNDFYRMEKRMRKTKDFRKSAKVREKSLKEFRKAIKKGKLPDWMTEALGEVQARFPKGASIRCRSSTNSEDLPGFSGAGLYDSYTHHPDEGHLSKSVKQVFASLWNFRAFEEREFHRIDHDKTAMGVVLHLNSEGERANGVAVTRDVLYGTEEQDGLRFYVNAQLGEDLVTNPEAGSTPEELLISPRNPKRDIVIRRSSRTSKEAPLLGADKLLIIRRALRAIDAQFRKAYGIEEEARFAMEIEFKVEKDGAVLIKQARPWVFH